MKRLSLFALLLVLLAFVGGLFFFRPQKAPPPVPPEPPSIAVSMDADANPATGLAGTNPVSQTETVTNGSQFASTVTTNTTDTMPDHSAWHAAFAQTMDTIVSTRATLGEKQAAWKQLMTAGNLDQAIAVLKQAAPGHPDDANYSSALGRAELLKAGELYHNGGSVSDLGMLGMQADKSFEESLKIDPANWEAQFYKATAMSHWPPELNKGEEVIQRLTRLIDQQDKTSAPQPEFAQTYVLLGDQYKNAQKPDYAEATWRLGASKFPQDTALQKRITNLPR